MRSQSLVRLAVLLWLPLAIFAVLAHVDAQNEIWPNIFAVWCFALLTTAAGVRFGMHYGRLRELAWHQKLMFATPFFGLFALLLPAQYAVAIYLFAFSAQGAIDAWGGQTALLPLEYANVRVIMVGLIVVTLLSVLALSGLSLTG